MYASPPKSSAPPKDEHPLKVYLICTGVGVYNRGIESFFRECFDGLHPLAAAAGIQLELLKGRGPDAPDEHRVWCLPRTGITAKMLGKVVRRKSYVVEELSSLPAIVRRIRRGRPQVILYSDSDMARRLFRYRDRIGVPYRLIYSNGAPLPPPFIHCDHVQQLAPFYLQQALDAGEEPARHSLVPYGFTVPAGSADLDPALRPALRGELQLPRDRRILISVGWISPVLKRMDYLIREVASLPEPRPYLVMLGAMDHQTPPILDLARRMLGEENFTARSAPYEQVSRYYRAADAFALCSLMEGFGRVYIEALIHGLPVAAHDHPVMRFVLDDEGEFGDFSRPGGLAPILARLFAREQTLADMSRRRESVRRRFAWETIAPAYFQMFRAAAARPMRQS